LIFSGFFVLVLWWQGYSEIATKHQFTKYTPKIYQNIVTFSFPGVCDFLPNNLVKKMLKNKKISIFEIE
jgi:hypothetical protein